MGCVCQRCHKECSTRTCADDYNYCLISPNWHHLYDHGFMDGINTSIVRQSVNHKKIFKWFKNSRRITLKTIKKTIINKKTCYNIKCTYIYYFICVAIPANIMSKRDFHAYETRIYILRFHFPSLYGTFDTFHTLKWCIMPQYKSIAMIMVTKLSTSNHIPCKHLRKKWLNAQTSEYGPYFVEAAIL